MSLTSTSVRSSLNEQLSRLHGKHNAELELLEDIKQFSRQRSVMEKQYSEVSLVYAGGGGGGREGVETLSERREVGMGRV